MDLPRRLALPQRRHQLLVAATAGKTYCHYSKDEHKSFLGGLLAGSAATTASGLSDYLASQSLGVPLSIYYEYPVTVDPNVTPVSRISIVQNSRRFFGGVSKYSFGTALRQGR